MKTVTAKMLVSLIGVLIVTPFFAIALIVGARAVSVSQGTQDDLLLAALALAGAAASVINGIGRRSNHEHATANTRIEKRERALRRDSSKLHLGY